MSTMNKQQAFSLFTPLQRKKYRTNLYGSIFKTEGQVYYDGVILERFFRRFHKLPNGYKIAGWSNFNSVQVIPEVWFEESKRRHDRLMKREQLTALEVEKV